MPVTVGPTSPAKRGPYMTQKRRRMLEASAEVTPVAKHTGSLTTIHMAPTVTVQSVRTAPNEKHVHVPLRTYTCGLPEPPIEAARDAVESQLAAARVAHTAARQAERVASAAATLVREEEGQGNPPPGIPPRAALKEEGMVPPMPAGAFVKEEEVPPMPAGAFVKEEEVPPMPAGAFVKQEEVPPMPAGAFVKQEEVPPMPAGAFVKQEEVPVGVV